MTSSLFRSTLLVLALGACASQSRTDADTAAGALADDPDRATAGQGVPSGFMGRTDRTTQNIADASYTARGGGRFEVKTGPAHILWAAEDTARGAFTVATTFEQLEAPTHPEAFGIFIGGRDLDGDDQTYTYLVVRGTGEYLIRVREGSGTRTVAPWTANEAIPKQDAGGRATYRLAIRAAADSVRFLVNGRQVTAVPSGTVPTDGIYGLRINHNLHVLADRVRVGG